MKLFKLIIALLKLIPADAFGEAGGNVRSSGPVTLDSLSADIDSIPEGTEFRVSSLESGKVGGPVTDALVASVLTQLREYVVSQLDERQGDLETLIRKLTDKVSFLP